MRLKILDSTWRWWLMRLAYLLAATMVFTGLLGDVMSAAGEGNASLPAWAFPNAIALKRATNVIGAQSQPGLLQNLDCSSLTYRGVGSQQMQTGCFTTSAIGLIESDSQQVIFNGTDEAMPLKPYVPNQILAPWPQAGQLLALDPVGNGAASVGLYTAPWLYLRDELSVTGDVFAKRLTAAPNILLKNTDGQRLAVNIQSIAFASNGAWMVAETTGGNFVRVNLATLDTKAFAPSFGTSSSPGLLSSQVAVSDSGNYVAISNKAAGTFQVYDLTSCPPAAGARYEACPAHDYRPFIDQQVSGVQTLRHVRFSNDGLLAFEVIASDHAKDGFYVLAPRERITSLIDYLGLGDSFTSGEGAYNYLNGTDTGDNMCHLSIHSYPLLLSSDLYSAQGGHSVACSGAVIKDIANTSDSYRGQVRGVASYANLRQSQPGLLNSVMANFAPGYIAQQRFVSQYQPAALTVSVGGNDVGFGDILERCAVPHIGRHLSDSVCFNTYEDRLEVLQQVDRTIPKWVNLYRQLQTQAPLSNIYAVGYPSIIKDGGDCGLNVNLNQSEIEFAHELVVYINNSIQQAANKAGVYYVDIEDALDGHRLCEAGPAAVNGLTAGKDIGIFGIEVFGKESYHPNALGHQLIEAAILRKTNNMTARLAAPAANPDTTKLLSKPKSGRVTNKRLPAQITDKTVGKGKSISIKVNGADNGLKPGTGYTIHLDGPNGPVIGQSGSDDNGDIDTTVIIPGDTGSGGHSIDVTGGNQSGNPVDVTQPIYVPDPNPPTNPPANNDSITPSHPATPSPAAPLPSQPGANNSDHINDSRLDDQPSAALGPIGLKLSAARSSSQVLGAKMTSPGNLVNHRAQAKRSANRGPKFAKIPLRVINWLPWLGLLVLLWVIVLIAAYWLARRLSRQKSLP